MSEKITKIIDGNEMLNELVSLRAAVEALNKPVNMLLWCPVCHLQHIDKAGSEHTEDEGWSNPPHRSHLCAFCGCVWRPSDRETNGVASIATRGQLDTWSLVPITSDVTKI